MSTFAARYAGTCPDCLERVRVGDTVRFNDGNRVVHDVCVPELSRLDLKPNEEVCTVCWLVKPCECEES